MGRQTNRWTSGPWPGLIHPETPSSLEAQQGCSEEGDRERQRGSERCWPRSQAEGQTALRHVAVGTSGPKGEGADSVTERPAQSGRRAPGAGQLPARVRLGERGAPSWPCSPRCAQESLLQKHRGCGHGHSADPQASPDTPVRGPILHLEQASPRDSDAHGCLRTMSQDPYLPGYTDLHVEKNST